MESLLENQDVVLFEPAAIVVIVMLLSEMYAQLFWPQPSF